MKYQRISLASHVLYGSSRLGTRDYLPGEHYVLLDYTGSSPVKDTATLEGRKPWYSAKYNDVIENTATSPWGHTQYAAFSMADMAGAKQYELTNHLGNVMATVSDNKYAYYNQADSVLGWHPALRAAYDYYPFGMLMPGRYVSDTSQNCVTVTQPKWAWEWIAVKCWTVNSWQWPYYKPIHDGFAEGAEDAVQVTALNPGDGVSFQMSVTANEKQELNVDVQRIAMSKGATVQVLEQENGRWVSLAEASLDKPDNISLIFTPTQGNVQIQITGPVQTLITKLCLYAYQEVEKDELVTICSEDKDKYRFGYNNKEKINEWAGVGNYLDFGARGLDTRVGRWLAKDPLAIKYPFSSPYAFSLNTPIRAKDPDGKVVIFINGQHGKRDKSDYWGIFKRVNLGIMSEKDGFGRWHTSAVTGIRETYAFDKAVMDRIGDHKAIYKDGSMGGWNNTLLTGNNIDADYRKACGVVQGMKDAKSIIAGLRRDKDGKIAETIKIITHSMGGAYAKGYSYSILKYAKENKIKGVNIEFEVDFAPFQPNKQTATKGVRTIQVGHKYDRVVNNVIMIGGSKQAKEEGVKDSDYHLNTTDENKGHSIFSFEDEINSTVPQSVHNH